MSLKRSNPHPYPNPNLKHFLPSSSSSSNSNSNSNSSVTILVYDNYQKDSSIKKRVSFLTNWQERSVLEIDLPSSKHWNFHGHSHGIICLSVKQSDVFLCNPNTKEFRQLPRSSIFNDRYCDVIAMGFGYDPKSNDFKVFRVMIFIDPPYHYNPSRVEIYDLSTDQWREIKAPVPGYFYNSEYDFCHNGVYYTFAVDKNYEHILISFDMSEEVFKKIPLPEGISYLMPHGNLLKFGVWKGSVVLFHYKFHECSTCDILGMKKDESGEFFWTKLLTISSLPEFTWPVLFVNSDELIMSDIEGVRTYNLNTKEFTSLKGDVCRQDINYSVFEKSFLSVKGGMVLELPLKSCNQKMEILFEEEDAVENLFEEDACC